MSQWHSFVSGTTGEKILLVGDSAGGCFTITTSMKIKQLRLRLPDQIFSFYPPCFVSTAISPSRFLSLIDPILPIGILISCLQVSIVLIICTELKTLYQLY